MKYLLTLLLLFFLSACSQINTLAYEDIADLKELPQNAVAYTSVLDENRSLYEIQSQYATNYFKAWHMSFSKLSIDAMKWPFKSYTPKNSFGENLQPISQSLLDQLEVNTNSTSYATINLRGITVHQASLRALPTDKPFFNDPRKAGEGFPFDYLQESSIHINEPIFVSHYSLDGAWAHISTSYAQGWIHTNDFVLLSEQQCNEFENAKKISITMDDFPIKDDKDQFLFYSKIGMQFPFIQENNNSFYASVIVAGDNRNAVYKHVSIPKTIATSDILSLNQQNVRTLVDAIVHTHYGWGGMYGERDCSSTLRDLFTPFGIWLPRNSSYQAKVGKVISLENLEDDKKIELIKKEGVPFETLLHKKGHILLYTGIYDNKVIVMHNMWGLSISDGEKSGRVIVGKIVFSTLEIGKEHKYHKGTLLSKLDSMNILTLKP